MKLMIASDIHGSAYYCQRLLEAYINEGAGKLLLLGDLLNHGPRNDLPRDYDPKRVIELLNSLRGQILCVRGNCEAEVDQMVLQFPIMADYGVLWLEGRTIYASHGHHFNKDNPPPMSCSDILVYGHTHVPLCEVTESGIFMNPGSVSIPKENSPHGYLTAEGSRFRWMAFNGGCYRQTDLA